MDLRVLVVLISKDKPMEESYFSIANQSYPHFSILTHSLKPEPYHQNPLINKYLNCTRNRNMARAMALGSGMNHFLFVDDDTVLPVDALSNLMAHRKDIIGGWYQMIEGDWVVGKFDENRVFENFQAPLQGVVEVDMIGMGCLLITREALNDISFKPGVSTALDDLILNKKLGYSLAGECMEFGKLAKEKGYKLYIDGSVICTHMKREV